MIKLKEIRNSRNMKQSELSEKIGISVQTISSWENGKTPIDAPSILSICEVLECSPNMLLGWNVEHCEVQQSKEESELLRKWRRMDAQSKRVVMGAIDIAQPKKREDNSIRGDSEGIA